MFRTLIIDDEETFAQSLSRLLQRRGIEADVEHTATSGLARARGGNYDLIVLDHLLPDGVGLDLIEPLCALRPSPAVLMMTAYGTIENAVEAMRRGAIDYIIKTPELLVIVERITDVEAVGRARTRAQEPVQGLFPELVGESPIMREVRQQIAELAQAPHTTVHLMGESGTGKGVVARSIHARGELAAQPFVVVDCVALPSGLAESELFGHERGAFTGATERKIGKLEAAATGTVFLDEIGDMELALQGKLLRVLEERVFERVGGVKTVAMEARVISATHRDLGKRVEEGSFRLDLFHRLSVVPLFLPPLRARVEDIPRLTDLFLTEAARKLKRDPLTVDAQVLGLLQSYDFPGNVRELKNMMERATVLAKGAALTAELLPERVRTHHPAETPVKLGLPTAAAGGLQIEFRPGHDTLEDLERRLLSDALAMAGGRKGRAAEILGISRFSLLRRIEKYGL